MKSISYWHILDHIDAYRIKEKRHSVSPLRNPWGTGLYSRNPGYDVHQGTVEAVAHGDSSSAKCERSMGCFINAMTMTMTNNGRVATALASCCSLGVPAK